MHAAAAVDVDGLAGDEARGVGQQEDHRAHQIVRHLGPLEGAPCVVPAAVVGRGAGPPGSAEGATGRAFEVTVDGEIVWEYINPYFYASDDQRNNFFRAYRVPYEWIPQLTPPQQRPVVPPDISEFRIEPQ